MPLWRGSARAARAWPRCPAPVKEGLGLRKFRDNANMIRSDFFCRHSVDPTLLRAVQGPQDGACLIVTETATTRREVDQGRWEDVICPVSFYTYWEDRPRTIRFVSCVFEGSGGLARVGSSRWSLAQGQWNESGYLWPTGGFLSRLLCCLVFCWFETTVLDSFLSCLSLLPLDAGAGAPVDFTDCFHAYMRLHIEQGTVSDRFFHGIAMKWEWLLVANWRFPLTFAVLSRLCHARLWEATLCSLCTAQVAKAELWFEPTVLDSFLSSLSLLPLVATAEAPVDFMDCFHAYMRLHIEQETVSDSSMASVLRWSGLCSALLARVALRCSV